MNRSCNLLGRIWLAALFLAACSTPTPAPSPAPSPVPSLSPTPPGRVVVRWLDDTGGGWHPEQAWVDEFNASQDRIQLELMREHYGRDWLLTLMANFAENDQVILPDIIGPGAPASFRVTTDEWAYLILPGYNFNDFVPASLRPWKDESHGLRGLPLVVYPSVIFYNRDLFDAAGIPYPPQRYGEPYADGQEWTIEKLEEIAIRLTLDEMGRHPTDPGFDPDQIVQYGFSPQWLPAQDLAALFGPARPVNEIGEPFLPAAWEQAFHWYHAGIWEKHFIPSGEQTSSELANAFDSGRVAMAYTHTWYVCCLNSTPNWGLAVLPSHDGQVSATVDSMGLAVLNTSRHPEEASQVVYYLASLPELVDTLDGIPARTSLQAAYFAKLDQLFPQQVDWQVALDGLAVPVIPGYDSYSPADPWLENSLYTFMNEMNTRPNLDLDAALARLLVDFREHIEETRQ